MPVDLTDTQLQQMIIVLSALSVMGVVLTVAWPWIARNRFAERMQLVERGLRQARRREPSRNRAPHTARSPLSAREPNRVLAEIVRRLGLARLTNESGASELLRMAGLRGRAPLIAFLASRLIAAVVMPGLAFAYITLVVKPDLPLPVIAAMASVGAAIGFWLPAIYVRNLIGKRHSSLRRSWPDALDLLLICVESGMSSEAAFRKVAEEIGSQSKELAE